MSASFLAVLCYYEASIKLRTLYFRGLLLAFLLGHVKALGTDQHEETAQLEACGLF